MIIRRYSINEKGPGPAGPGPQPGGHGPENPGGRPGGAPRHVIDADAAILIGGVLPPRPAGVKGTFDRAVETILRCINNSETDGELKYYRKALKSICSEISKRV